MEDDGRRLNLGVSAGLQTWSLRSGTNVIM